MQNLFHGRETHCFSVDEVVSETGLSKTTARRYLEHCVEVSFLEVEMLYGKIGHPRRMYRRARRELRLLPQEKPHGFQKPRCSLMSSGFLDLLRFLLRHFHHLRRQPLATSLSG